MMQNSKWKLTDEEKQMLIAAITQELIPLRSKAGISQGELANLIGVSRQTYGAIERGDREMTWNTYLHLYPREEERAVAVLDEIILKLE